MNKYTCIVKSSLMVHHDMVMKCMLHLVLYHLCWYVWYCGCVFCSFFCLQNICVTLKILLLHLKSDFMTLRWRVGSSAFWKYSCLDEFCVIVYKYFNWSYCSCCTRNWPEWEVWQLSLPFCDMLRFLFHHYSFLTVVCRGYELFIVVGCCYGLQWSYYCITVVVAERADLNEVNDNRDFTVMSCWDPPSQ